MSNPTESSIHLRCSLLFLACMLTVCPVRAHAQSAEHDGEIEGVVRDADSGAALAGATVRIAATGQGAVSHGDGSFHLVRIAPGSHTLIVERLGYATRNLEVSVDEERPIVLVEMTASALDIGGLVITGALSERGARETLRPVNVLSGQELQQRLQSTVAATLASEPGLASTTMGPATARPVIRGMSGDRVLMLEDGARVGDVSNSGSDHATALDPSSARRIEVVRGPAALLYGSNALGGVINVIRDEVPTSVPHHPTGSATAQGQSVNNAFGLSGSILMQVNEHIPLRLEGTGRRSQDLQTPAGMLSNTGAETWSAGLGSGWVDDWGHIGASFRAYQNDYGIPGGFTGGHEEGVRVEMERTSAKVRTRLNEPFGPFQSLQVDGVFTDYRHKEIEPPGILGTLFERTLASGDVLARHDDWGPFSAGAMGGRASWEDLDYGGTLRTPNSRRYTAAAFVFEEIELEPVRIEVGLRYDWVRVDPASEDPNSSIGNVRSRTFSSASGSLGVLYNTPVGVTVGASFAQAFRTPDVGELFSEGPHLAAYSWEVGNPDLGTEVGRGVDVFVRYGSETLETEIAAFYNDISGYIYGEATGAISPVQLPVYQFQGNDALLTGFEGGLHWQFAEGFELEGTGSYVRGTLQDTDEPLPLIPPFQGRVALEWDRTSWFARSEAKLAAQQTRIGEFETETPGYSLVHLVGGVRLTIGGRLNVLTLSIENLTNVEYRNHLSRVKAIMPEAGRGLSLTYRVVF
jgi:iron complex outermembrane receptor protein